MSNFGPLVDTTWLAKNLGRKDLKIIDGSWRMPGVNPACDDYESRHIEGAVFFDIDEISDKTSSLPHMAPKPEQFSLAVGGLGISNIDTVIVYDDQGCFSAARVWWTFRLMGHEKVAVLDGGLPKWRDDGHTLTHSTTTAVTADYQALHNAHHVCDATAIRQYLGNDKALVLDARPAQRFLGAAPEPRKGLRSGAMPGAANLPFGELFNSDKTFLNSSSLAARLACADVTPEKQIITTCGSGITAAVLTLALEITGHRLHKLYDGSWAEWGSTNHVVEEFPVVSDAEQ